jgi:hypothetical protein
VARPLGRGARAATHGRCRPAAPQSHGPPAERPYSPIGDRSRRPSQGTAIALLSGATTQLVG